MTTIRVSTRRDRIAVARAAQISRLGLRPGLMSGPVFDVREISSSAEPFGANFEGRQVSANFSLLQTGVKIFQ
jgi:hypothetical protein